MRVRLQPVVVVVVAHQRLKTGLNRTLKHQASMDPLQQCFQKNNHSWSAADQQAQLDP
jgi:hypothetical protein